MEKKNLGCNNDTYLKTDVLLLTDTFETFRKTCLKHYKLDAVVFYTKTWLAWQALLKTESDYCKHEDKDYELWINKFELEMLKEIDMLLMFEKGMRGGTTQHSEKLCQG